MSAVSGECWPEFRETFKRWKLSYMGQSENLYFSDSQ